jgi:hypothetical protein
MWGDFLLKDNYCKIIEKDVIYGEKIFRIIRGDD